MKEQEMTLEELERRRSEMLAEIEKLGDMRRGTLVERFLPCNKGDCHCTEAKSRGHGPKYSLTYKEKGKTKTEYIAVDKVERVKEQLAEHRRFLSFSQELVNVNEQISRLRLFSSGEDSKKNFSRKSGKKLQKRPRGY